MEKSLIGPSVINSWVFYICRAYPTILYRILQYSLVNCFYLQYFEFNVVNTHYKVTFSISSKIRAHRAIHLALLKNLSSIFDMKASYSLKNTWIWYQLTCLMLKLLFMLVEATTKSTMILVSSTAALST